MSAPRSSAPQPQRFVWEPQPAAAGWLAEHLARLQAACPLITDYAALLYARTGTRLADWIDHLYVTRSDGLEEAGFQLAEDGWWTHPGALLPPVRVTGANRLLLRVDSVSDFALANSSRYDLRIQGQPLDAWRTATFQQAGPAGSGVEFGVVERHGCHVRAIPQPLTDAQRLARVTVREMLRHRPRRFDSQQQAFASTRQLLLQAIQLVGRDTACDLFFAGERCYWQSRNRAAQLQYMRQNALGLGWGNQDHHTYRSSRSCFCQLMELLELLGFQCREQFYAGREAGWGAQVLDHPVCSVVIFADVDLDASEISGDIAHTPLPPRGTLGTIGLWCALHGEALFEAGMHHLECQFHFDGARSQLEALGVRSMPPFTNFPFLRQCFTEGERWEVAPQRIQRALSEGWITPEQAQRFANDGAVGSHLEILERNDGYRGFNQTGINDIIRQTDPRLLTVGQAAAGHFN